MMRKSHSTEAAKRELATSDDVARILGNLDPTKTLPIMALQPTIADIEEASMWLGGDRDVFGPGVLKGVVSQIVTILTADEEEEPPRLG
jgi:hypothetical protein